MTLLDFLRIPFYVILLDDVVNFMLLLGIFIDIVAMIIIIIYMRRKLFQYLALNSTSNICLDPKIITEQNVPKLRSTESARKIQLEKEELN